MTAKTTVEEYPQIRTMFADALRAMAEGETEAEKQIVYVLNEARAALPCPAFVAGGLAGSRHLFVMLGGKAISIVQVFSRTLGAFEVVSPCSDAFGCWTTEAGTLPLADGVLRALKAAHSVIMQAAAEAGPKAMRVEQTFSMSAEAMSREVAACFAETAKAREVAPGETIKGADVIAVCDVMPVENYGNWVLSFAGPHPTEDQVVHVTDRDQAFKAKRLVDSLLTR